MRIGLLRIGQIDDTALERTAETLRVSFGDVDAQISEDTLTVPETAFDEDRNQYRSEDLLNLVRTRVDRQPTFDRMLALTIVDLYASGMSYVFGQADCPGKAGLVSLVRLRQEFYGRKSDGELFLERAGKEAVHELGHTFGLQHCPNPFCVMHFSDSIFDTDRKQSLFCGLCQEQLDKIINP